MRRLAIVLLTTAAGLSLFAGGISAQDNQDGNDPTPDTVVTPGGATISPVDVLQVSGFMDDILISEIRNAIERADDSGAQALILQVNSDGTVVDDNVVEALLEDIATAPVPIGVWVGPTGSRFYGPAAQMLAVADVTGMAPGARVGYFGVPLNPPSAEIDFGVAEETLRNGSVGLSEARALDIFRQRISDEGIPTVTSMLQAMNG